MSSVVRSGIDVLQNEGLASFISRSSLYASRPVWNTVTSRRPVGTNIFDRDWDLLIVLDACRVDALRAMADRVSFVSDVGKMWSVGSHSLEWSLKTFGEEHRSEIADTAFVCRNALPDKVLVDRIHETGESEHGELDQGSPQWGTVTSEAFAHYELVRPIANHEDSALHPDSRIVPHVGVDRAIAVGREKDFDRMIVHLNSPHLRFITGGIDWTPGETSMATLMDGPETVRPLEPEEKSYDPAQRGDVSRERMVELYRDELRFILDYVEILLENVDAETAVITADHGEALGEMGIWAHPFGWPLPPVKTVPWMTTTATDEGTYEPRYDPVERRESEAEHEEFLRDMGYL